MKDYLVGGALLLSLAGAMAVGWVKYSNFLTSGMRPSVGTQKLNQMEKVGALDFALNDLDGNEVRLSQFKDRVVILSFWASWCDPCVAEFPSMVKLVEFFKGKVILVAVSADRHRDDILSFLKPYGGKAPENVVILWDEKQTVATQYGTEVLPESFVLGPGLKMLRKIAGSEDWFTPEAIQLFHQMTLTESGQAPSQQADETGK